jgi:inulin fructotransferase (DFA-I-forming)
MLVLENNCAENLISANHFLRDREPWPPMQAYDNGLDDAYGLLHINGSNNSVIANHISETIDVQYLKPRGINRSSSGWLPAKGIILRIIISLRPRKRQRQQAQPSEEDACFAAQVSALLTTARLKALDAVAVLVEKSRLKTRYLIAAATTR